MPGLMSRILSRLPAGAPSPAPVAQAPPLADPAAVPSPIPPPVEEAPTTVSGADLAPAPPLAEGAVASPVPPPAEEPPADATTVMAPVEPVPAAEPVAVADPAVAAEPAAAPAGASFKDRGKLRRRLRYLRGVRELGFRDLGGLVFDLHRFERDRPDLVRAKLDALAAIDSELRALEISIDDVRAIEELHQPGISACAHCGALNGSEARFCSTCGVAVQAPRAVPADLPPAAPEQPAA